MREPDVAADAVAEDAATAQQRLPPLLDRGEHLVRRQDRRAGCLLRRDLGLTRVALLGEVGPLVAEDPLDLVVRVEGLRRPSSSPRFSVHDGAREEVVPF